ncbi:TPA: hypothetical protein NGS68_000535 [Vibrio parahaemolyticus]|nr:hypothetical protein [Vibrio parahaemolyticus]HCG6655989.1 hypothetical protein [Vibrio parahaemolyticus]HCG6660041.1 hypothetical protein [Vibrio parahaemolyticus]
MSKKKMAEKELLEGLTPETSHANELATIGSKEWADCGKGLETLDDDVLAEREQIVGSAHEMTVNADLFINELQLALKELPVDEIELCDLANEIGRVIAVLAHPTTDNKREVIAGIEHGFELIAKEK